VNVLVLGDSTGYGGEEIKSSLIESYMEFVRAQNSFHVFMIGLINL
jgi:hypothetical protein